jgi:hypothetical protein
MEPQLALLNKARILFEYTKVHWGDAVTKTGRAYAQLANASHRMEADTASLVLGTIVRSHKLSFILFASALWPFGSL